MRFDDVDCAILVITVDIFHYFYNEYAVVKWPVPLCRQFIKTDELC